MGGGDLNMKKSWHTGTFANQERVWKREQEALAERKKVQQLQKELEQERAVQELQRLQAEAGGGKGREERVEWLYAAPAEGNGVNAEEMESYLLGKKRVDKLLKGNEEKLMAESNGNNVGGTSGTFTASTTANTARDTAAKIREDPLLAIKRQEQLQYEKMLKDPKRLKELRAAREGGGGKSSSGGGESKEERRARREKRRQEREDRHRDRDHRTSSKRSHRDNREDSYDDRDRGTRRRSKSPPPRRRRSYGEEEERKDSRQERYEDRRRPSSSRYHDHQDEREDRHSYNRRRSPSPLPTSASSSSRPPYRGNGYSSHSTTSTRPLPPPRPPAAPSAEELAAEESARQKAISARLEAMKTSAATLSSSRNSRLTEIELQEKLEKEKEDLLLKEKGRSGDGTGPRFMREIEKGVFGGKGGVAERIRRSGGVGMKVDNGD